MPFTANRKFASQPKMIEGGEGMYYTTEDGRQIIDGTAGLWVAMRVIADPKLLRRFPAKSKSWTTHPRFSWDILRHSNSLNVW